MMDRDRELHEMADEGRALMSDYIKRTDALDIVADNNVTGEITLNRYDKIIDGIYEIPSSDVVQVIRCKNCKFYDTPKNFKKPYCMRGAYVKVNADDYCSKGERR